jgi:transposase-like protein
MSTTSNQKRPAYSLEFKPDAAKLVNETGYTRRQAATSLGISLSVMGGVGLEQKKALHHHQPQKKRF